RVVRPAGRVPPCLPGGRCLAWRGAAARAGPATLRRQVPLHELPLYVREDSLVVLGPERSHVGERPADPLTVEAFVTAEARFALRGEAGSIALRCRPGGGRASFGGSRPRAHTVLSTPAERARAAAARGSRA